MKWQQRTDEVGVQHSGTKAGVHLVVAKGGVTTGDHRIGVSVQLSLRRRRGFPDVGLSALTLGKPRANRLAVPHWEQGEDGEGQTAISREWSSSPRTLGRAAGVGGCVSRTITYVCSAPVGKATLHPHTCHSRGPLWTSTPFLKRRWSLRVGEAPDSTGQDPRGHQARRGQGCSLLTPLSLGGSGLCAAPAPRSAPLSAGAVCLPAARQRRLAGRLPAHRLRFVLRGSPSGVPLRLALSVWTWTAKMFP